MQQQQPHTHTLDQCPHMPVSRMATTEPRPSDSGYFLMKPAACVSCFGIKPWTGYSPIGLLMVVKESLRVRLFHGLRSSKFVMQNTAILNAVQMICLDTSPSLIIIIQGHPTYTC